MTQGKVIHAFDGVGGACRGRCGRPRARPARALAGAPDRRAAWRFRQRLGTGYRVAVALVCASAVVLVAGWRGDLWWLAPVAVLSAVLAELGLRAAARPTRHRAAVLTHGLGGSYIALFTAFVVVALTVDGPVAGTAALAVWLAPTVLGTVGIERWRIRLADRLTCDV